MPAKNTVDSLETKYGDFNAPEADILIDGQLIRLLDMALEWVEVEQTTDSQADIARFCIANAFNWQDNTMSWVGTKIAVGKLLQVKLGYADKKGLVFDGIITGYNVEYGASMNPKVIVIAMDRSFLMMKSSHSKVWTETKDSDVVRQIAGEYGLSADIDATTVMKKTIEQIGVSDYHFIRSLAIDNDRHFYVTASKLYFKNPKTSGEPIVSLQYGKNLRDFTLQVDASSQVAEVKVRGYDVDKMEPIEASAKSVTKIGSSEKAGPSVAAQLSAKKVEIVYTQATSVDEATALAKAMLERLSRELVSGHGSCIGFPELMPGELIIFDGLGGTKLNHTARLTKVSHKLDAENGYVVYFETEGNAI
ncbi:phage late control D family protein [Paenibacillus harenae]|uniref:Phage protein D n=1 Tax=Paenibacillus harenae TaxID=306543 RepID=A0ABT9TUH1_PAEHA|nr:contractile injection system protein, VgrG/Pvc8 family [Paenibacillus harenae]MDQ0111001.1 phage protein D [Paenibacillus harenae]